jgi:hypothetical protein
MSSASVTAAKGQVRRHKTEIAAMSQSRNQAAQNKDE